ncbi:MAG: SAM-dependent methyltransferase [Bacteroidales bacterium]|jgi:16S rRNA G966 N2-methylase RsmD|nr:SAM-dependent methyltransferase [Bacteroidales bacterium]
MPINNLLLDFIYNHSEDNLIDLLLHSDQFPGIDLKLAVNSIEARKKIIEKVPEWDTIKSLYFPKKLNAEQASSMFTALYKQRFSDGGVIVDLTGGYGIDSFYLSKKSSQLHYIEADPEIYEATLHNFNILNINNVVFHNITIKEGSLSTLELPSSSLIYLDPSRRRNSDIRHYLIEEYEPNFFAIKDELFNLSSKVLLKVSPMLDITESLRKIPQIREIHVLSVGNECKELLFLIEKDVTTNLLKNTLPVFTVNFSKSQNEYFDFDLKAEKKATAQYSQGKICKYIYEPNSSIIKAGAFVSISLIYDIFKLSKHTHLYTSDCLIPDFPGRKFEVIEIMEFKKKDFINIKKRYPKANITTRNFPLNVKELREILKISDGGDIYIFGCMLEEKRILISCRKIT